MTSVQTRKSSPAGGRLRPLGDQLLTALAVAGAISLMCVLLGFVFQLSLLMFRTGSMGPTIPAGSIALAREIPAAEVSPGDVVTVNRGDGLLPLTHRVVGISKIDPATGDATFTIRGDANPVDDPRPYTESAVRLVMFSAPGGASILQWFNNPAVLGGLTLAASALVGWAFWIRDDDEKSPSRASGAAPATDPGHEPSSQPTHHTVSPEDLSAGQHRTKQAL